MKTTKKAPKKRETERKLEKISEIAQEKQDTEEQKENDIENGKLFGIMLSGDILLGGKLYRKGVKYDVEKEVLKELTRHTTILGIALHFIP